MAGIIQYLKENGGKVTYDPKSFWQNNTIQSALDDLHRSYVEEEKQKKANGWKLEYFMSIREAKTANLMSLKWMCENYRVIGGSEACLTIRQREIIINYPTK